MTEGPYNEAIIIHSIVFNIETKKEKVTQIPNPKCGDIHRRIFEDTVS